MLAPVGPREEFWECESGSLHEPSNEIERLKFLRRGGPNRGPPLQQVWVHQRVQGTSPEGKPFHSLFLQSKVGPSKCKIGGNVPSCFTAVPSTNCNLEGGSEFRCVSNPDDSKYQQRKTIRLLNHAKKPWISFGLKKKCNFRTDLDRRK